ncbi:Bug family tripartite tricarboxylate transporter substrate binding protein [Paracidovorax citrulli]
MKILSRTRTAVAAAILGITILPAAQSARASEYPTRPIRVVVPYGPGGTGDVIARMVAQRLSQTTGQSVVVDNRPGGVGVIGATNVAKAEPDGYTVLLGYTSEMVISPALIKGVSYRTERDFLPVAFAGSTPLVLVANPSVGVKTYGDLIKLAKSRPVSYASAGNGSPAHIAGALMAKAAALSMLHVPYKGGSQAVSDVLGGNVDVYFSGIPPAIPFIQSGQLIALGVTAAKSSPSLPSVPGIASKGSALDLSGWFGAFVPKGVSPQIVSVLNSKINEALQRPEIREKLLTQGVETNPMTPEQFQSFVHQERKKYERLIQEIGIAQE